MVLTCLVGAQVEAQARPEDAAPAIEVDHGEVPHAGCLSAFELRRRVEQRTGPLDLSRRAGRRVVVRYRRSPRAEGFRVEVLVYDAASAPTGARELEVPGSDCSRADEAVVLITSTLFGLAPPAPTAEEEPAPTEQDAEPTAPEAATEPSTEPSNEPSTPAPAAPTRRATPERRRRPREPWHLLGVGAAGLSSGVTPGPAVGVTLGGSLLRPRMSLGLFADALPRSQHDLGEGAEARFHAAWVRSEVCGRVAEGARARFGVCVALRGGFVQASTRGLPQATPVLAPEVGALLGFRLLLGRKAARAGAFVAANLSIPLIIQRFWVQESDGVERLYHESHPGVWLSVGLSLGPRS